jgi:hypothetical protein
LKAKENKKPARRVMEVKKTFVIVKATGERGLILDELLNSRPNICFRVKLDTGEVKNYKFNELKAIAEDIKPSK